MEHIAAHLGADPVAVRQENFLKAYPFDAPPPQPLPHGARPTAAAPPPPAASCALASSDAPDCPFPEASWSCTVCGSAVAGAAAANVGVHKEGSVAGRNKRVPGGCGRLNGWTPPPAKRLMRTSLGRCGCTQTHAAMKVVSMTVQWEHCTIDM